MNFIIIEIETDEIIYKQDIEINIADYNRNDFINYYISKDFMNIIINKIKDEKNKDSIYAVMDYIQLRYRVEVGDIDIFDIICITNKRCDDKVYIFPIPLHEPIIKYEYKTEMII